MSIAETRREQMFPCFRDARTPIRANRQQVAGAEHDAVRLQLFAPHGT